MCQYQYFLLLLILIFSFFFFFFANEVQLIASESSLASIAGMCNRFSALWNFMRGDSIIIKINQKYSPKNRNQSLELLLTCGVSLETKIPQPFSPRKHTNSPAMKDWFSAINQVIATFCLPILKGNWKAIGSVKYFTVGITSQRVFTD